MKLKVLLVDDDPSFAGALANAVAGQVELLWAASQTDAERQVSANPDLVAIIMDGHLVRGQIGPPDTLDLVRSLRRHFSGPIVACSSDDEANHELENAGCDFTVGNRKSNIVTVLPAVLAGLNPPLA